VVLITLPPHSHRRHYGTTTIRWFHTCYYYLAAAVLVDPLLLRYRRLLPTPLPSAGWNMTMTLVTQRTCCAPHRDIAYAVSAITGRYYARTLYCTALHTTATLTAYGLNTHLLYCSTDAAYCDAPFLHHTTAAVWRRDMQAAGAAALTA